MNSSKRGLVYMAWGS